MPVVSAGNLTLLRSEYHRHAVRFSWLVPPTLWTARIDDVSIVKGETSIDFDTGAGSFFSMVGNLQEVWVGSTPAANDVGRLRIKSISSGDAGVTGTLTVGGHSHPLQDDLYLTFLHDYPLKPKFSYIDPSTETWYMDDDVTYSDQHTKPPSVVIAGPHRAAFLDDVSGDVLFNVDASASYTIASGATKSSYGLTVASTAGAPTVNFNTGTGLGDITFDAAGVYWARYTVTDSNGKTQESYRCYIIHDPDAQAGSYPWTFCERVQLEDDWENGGWTAGVRAKDDFALSDIPDHTLCIIWQDAEYGGTQGPITFLPDDNQAVFVGYVREDSDTQDMAAGFGEVDLVLSTIEGRLRRIFSFSTSLIADKNPNDWYEYESWITCGRIVHDLFLWRCNLLEIADVFGLTDDTLNRMFQAFDEGNIYDNANNFLYNEGIRKRVLCDQGGRVHISSEQQLLVDSDRGALTTSFELIQTAGIGDYGESLVIERKQEFQVPFVTGNGIYWDGATWDGDNRPEATGDFCSIAPGGKPLYDGPSPQDFPKQTVSSQANLNAIIGRYEAKLNNPVGEIILRFHGAYNTVLDAAYGEEYIMDLQASENPRGISWSNKPLYLKHVQAIFEASPGPGTWEVHASFEPEHITTDGVFTECPSFPPLGGVIPPIPTPEQMPGALMTGASVNLKPVTSDLWTQPVAQAVTDLISDPFWRTKQGTSSPSSAIVFRCGVGYIRRTTDAFATTDVDITPGTNPPNDAGDSPAPTTAAVTFVQTEASYIDQDRFLFLATWQNVSSDWRSWLLYTDDNGSTWTWETIGTFEAPASSTDITGYAFTDLDTALTSQAIRGVKLNSVRYFVHTDTNKGHILSRSGNTFTLEASDTATGQRAETDPRVFRMSDSEAWVMGMDRVITPIRRFVAQEWSVPTDTTVSHVATYTSDEVPISEPTSEVVGNTRFTSLTDGRLVGIYRHAFFDDILVGMITFDTVTNTWSSVDVIYQDDAGGSWSTLDIIGLDDRHVMMLVSRTSPVSGLECWIRDMNTGIDGPSTLVSADHTVGFQGDIRSTILPDNRVVYGAIRNNGATNLLEPHVIQWDGLTTAAPAVGPAGELFGLGDDSTSDVALVGDGVDHILVVRDYNGAQNEQQARSYRVRGLVTYRHNNLTFQFNDTEVDAEYFRSVHGLFHDTGNFWVNLTRRNFINPGYPRIQRVEVEEPGPVTFSAGHKRGLGLSIGKSAGNRAWVTSYEGDDDELLLLDYHLPSLGQLQSISMGAATLSEVNAKTYICYPFVPFGFDDAVYVYGRMNDPDGLGNPSHIIRTVNGGSSFTLIEGGWTFDHCGALVIDIGGTMFAIRNQSAKATLYRDNADNNLLLRLTLPFDAPVAPHGMLVDFATQDVYPTSWLADSVMVVKVSPPHLTYTDLTFNHDNTDGIESIIGL